MSTYRFIGDYALLYEGDTPIELNRFGQKIELTPDQEAFCLTVRPGAGMPNIPILPEAQWQSAGISEEEVQKFPSAVSHDPASVPKVLSDSLKTFLEKKQKAIDLMQQLSAAAPVEQSKPVNQEA